jgi:hypothetical protein
MTFLKKRIIIIIIIIITIIITIINIIHNSITKKIIPSRWQPNVKLRIFL